MDMITSRQNPRFKEIKKLTEDKKYRQETGKFFVDGVNFVAQALENNWEVLQLVYVPEKIDTDFKKKIISQVEEEKHFQISEQLYEALATKKDIQGVGAVVRQKLETNKLLPGNGVVLENIANPGNLGSIARLCAAFEINNLYTVAPAVEFFHPEAVRASMGAIFHLNLVLFDSIEEIKHKLLESSRHCIGTSLQDDSIEVDEYMKKLKNSRTQNLNLGVELIWFGSEAKGMTQSARDLCQTLVRIPVSNRVDSLNVAESAGIVLYELRIKKPHPPQ